MGEVAPAAKGVACDGCVGMAGEDRIEHVPLRSRWRDRGGRRDDDMAMRVGFGRAAVLRSRCVVPLICCALSATLGCESPMFPEGGPGYTGEVQSLDPRLGTRFPDNDALVTKVWVRHDDDECGLIVSVYDDTVLRHADDREASIADFEPGSTVDVWHTGLILDSCPGQVGGVAIRLR